MKILSAVALLALTALFVFLARTIYIADSEFWTVNVAYNWRDFAHQNWFWSRTLHHFLFALFFDRGDSAVENFMTARTVSGVIAAVLTAATVRWAYLISRSWAMAAAVGILLLLNSVFLFQAFRIRADLLCVTILMIGLCLPGRIKWVLWALSLATTPKAVVFALCFLPLYAHEDFRRLEKRRMKFWAATAVSLLIAAAGISFAFVDGFFDFVVKSFIPSNEGPGAFSTKSFTYVFRLFSTNPWFAILLVASAFLSIRSWRSLSAERKTLVLSVLLSTAAILMSPEKVPFFLAAFLPLFTVWICWSLRDMANRLGRRGALAVSGAVLIGGIAFGAPVAHRQLTLNTNTLQVDAIDRLEKYLARTSVMQIYDTVGLTLRPQAFAQHIGPHEKGNDSLLGMLKYVRNQPGVIIYTRRLWLLEPDFSATLDRYYFRHPSGVWTQAWTPHPTEGAEKLEGHYRKRDFKLDARVTAELAGLRADGSQEFLLVEVSTAELLDLMKRPPQGVRVRRYSLFPMPKDFPTPLTDLFAFDARM